MDNLPSAEYLKEIARQLGCPDGEQGVKTGEVMHINNIGMTRSSIEALNLKAGELILEIGHGNGGHISELLKKAQELKYFGIDISETIIAEAERINKVFVAQNAVSFKLVDGASIPFEDHNFNKIFTVNTLYFWKNPVQYLKEIKRVLKPDGLFVLCFADKNFMQSLPFTQYGFKLYEEEAVTKLLTESGFVIEKLEMHSEQIQSNAVGLVTRNYYTITSR